MFAISSGALTQRATVANATKARRSTRARRSTATAIRAEAEGAKAAPAAPAAWTAPKLNPNTPSPIFGGSTGGLLRKAQVRAGARARANARRSTREAGYATNLGAMDGTRYGRRRSGVGGRTMRERCAKFLTARGRAGARGGGERARRRARDRAIGRGGMGTFGAKPRGGFRRRRRRETDGCDDAFGACRLRSSTCSRGKRRRKPSSRCRCVD